jgi:exodeoxyribonuclease V alpha subunit
MLDLALATRLLEAVPPQARVVLLGDKDQLAAVEAGAVFAELGTDPTLSPATTARLARLCGLAPAQIRPPVPARPAGPPGGQPGEPSIVPPDGQAAGAPAPSASAAAAALQDSVVWFQRNHRFAHDSGIGRLAAEALAGDAAAVLATLRAPPDAAQAGLAWLADAGDRPAAATLDAAVDGHAAYAAACRSALDRQAASRSDAGAAESDPATVAALHAAFGRFRVLCAVRGGARGVEAVNAVLSRRLRAAITGQPTDAASDRQPWYPGRPVMVLRNDPGLRLFNGDIGLALPAADGALQVWFPAADGQWRAVPPARLPAHETAWAMTVHKSQGSEFDAVLLLLPAQRSRVLSRELLYTGITRARQQVTVAAGADVLAATVRASSQRHAGLQARLRDLRAHDEAAHVVLVHG